MRLRKNKANTLKVSNRGVIRADFHRNKWAYFMFIPVLVWYIVFCYAPMYGAIIAFKDYSPSLGILGSKWVGLKWIKEFVTDYYFLRLMKNNLVLSVNSLVVNFPIPTIVVMLILRIGGLLNVGYEKIILLYNEGIYDTADVISSFVYRRGIVQSDWSYSAAVGLFNSVINFILIITANKISNRLTENGLW